MPELAEVEFMRRRWDVALGSTVLALDLHPRARVFRDTDLRGLRRALQGARFEGSARSGKQMLFRFGAAGSLGLHLGMTGELRVEAPDHRPGRHDHLVLRQAERSLVFRDPRMFGAVEFADGPDEPEWWRNRPPEILDPAFTPQVLAAFLKRRARAPLKAVLLMQERFPGIGNWMADEVLWRAGIHPARQCGSLAPEEVASLFRELRFVCRAALRTIVREMNGSWSDPPKGWLFHVRWNSGGRCPRTGGMLVYETFAGRTTCWSPGRQSAR